MGEQRFRVWFGEEGASEEELARIEEIEVTQEMDAIWEARMRLGICLDERGSWKDRPDRFAPFSRVRVELDAGSGKFVPLIDGPVASFETDMSSQPGRSTATIIVRDDSVFLNREEAVETFYNRRDSDVADEMFRKADQIKDTRIKPPTSGTHPSTVRRGTPMQFLRELARANNRHAYVLPGEKPGQSIGCFLPDPEDPADLPKLVLLGDDRTLTDATIEEDPEGPERTRGRTLHITDGSEVTFETSATDLGLMRDLPAVPEDLTPLRLLPPADNQREDPEPAVTSQARSASYAFRLSSQVVPGCYDAVLTPYQKVAIEAGATPYSGEYLITKVVHRITLSVYTQGLEAKSDSRTDVPAAPVAEAAGGGLSLSFSASVSIF